MPANQGDWAIAGGGMLGLSLASRLARAGHRVTVFESAGSVGGLANSWEIGGTVWDKFYHVILASDVHTRQLLRELRLEDDLQWRETRTGFTPSAACIRCPPVWTSSASRSSA